MNNYQVAMSVTVDFLMDIRAEDEELAEHYARQELELLMGQVPLEDYAAEVTDIQQVIDFPRRD